MKNAWAIGDYRDNERYHHITSYPLMKPRRRSKSGDSVVGSSFDDPQASVSFE